MAEKVAKKKEEVQKDVAKEAPKTDVKATEKKTESKATDKKIESKPVEKKIEAKKKYIPYVKKENKKKSKEALDNMKKLDERKHVPTMRGRFGKKNIRRKSIAKWDKWRKPHGIDLDKGINHGARPKIGYRSRVDLRHIHPSGYTELMVCNFNDLEKINPKIHAARLSATIGKKKRNEIVKKANEKGIWVLN
jgi:large subunit ribosomal protein L32e